MEPKPNLGLCNNCRSRVPAVFFTKDGEKWIRKDCPDCGRTESRVSRDAEVWQAKRDLWQYVDLGRQACSLHCDRCRIDHKPNIVFLDVTNRCNMNCPICIATIKGMGFDFNPPMDYFEKIFTDLAKMQPNPVLLLFGGEPTVREDLMDIIAIAKKHGLRPHVVTNGIRLADEEYCRKLCEARVPFRFGFDGRNADIYEKLRHNRPAYDKKMKALENLSKYSRRKHTIIATAGRGFNDMYMEDFFQFIHDNRDLISDVGMIPLTENWKPGEFDSGVHTTMEDVEKMVQAAIPGGEVEFVPAGLSYAVRQMRSFFRDNPRSEVLLLAGAHPNCESMTMLISDGKRYRGINHYLKLPFSKVMAEVAAMAGRMEPFLNKLDRNKRFQRLRGQVYILRRALPFIFRTVRVGRLFRNPFRGLANILFKRGAKMPVGDKATPRRPRRVIRVAMLPFEEEHSIDAARLEKCKGVFAYEDAADGEVKYIPACLWYPYRNAFLERLSAKYGIVRGGKVVPYDPKENKRVQAEAAAEGLPASAA